MAHKKGKSERKTDWLGNKYIQHYDSRGNKSGKSVLKEGFFGNKYTQHYDAEGDKRGKSEKKEGFFGKKYTQKYNSKGDKSGRSEKKEGFFGNKYTQHYDSNGNKTDRSVKKEGLWGNQYVERYSDKPDPSSHETASRSYRGSNSPSSGISHSSSSSPKSFSLWNGLGVLIAIMAIIVIIWLASESNKTISPPHSVPPDISEADKRYAVYKRIVTNQQSGLVEQIISTDTFTLLGKVTGVGEPTGSAGFWGFRFVDNNSKEEYTFQCTSQSELYLRISNKDVSQNAAMTAMKNINNRVILYIPNRDKNFVDRCSRGSRCDGSSCPLGIEIE